MQLWQNRLPLPKSTTPKLRRRRQHPQARQVRFKGRQLVARGKLTVEEQPCHLFEGAVSGEVLDGVVIDVTDLCE